MTTAAPGRTRKIPHQAIVRAPGLLPMRYKTQELARALGVPLTMVTLWVRRGMPHDRDARNHIWLIGTEVPQWIEEQRAQRRGPKLRPSEGYCLRCRQAVRLSNPTVAPFGATRHVRRMSPLVIVISFEPER